MRLIDAVKRTRTLLGRDFGGDVAVDWEDDDALCQFTNIDLTDYLNDARNAYCDRKPIRDASSALTALTLTADAGGVVPVDPLVLAVRRVALASDPAEVLEARSMQELSRQWPSWAAQTGAPLFWIPDYDGTAFRVVPDPQEAVDLTLVIDRLPLVALDWDDSDEEIAEIPAAEHRVMCWYAAARALEASDNDQASLVKSWDAKVLQHWGAPLTPSQRAVRRRLAAGPLRVRALGY